MGGLRVYLGSCLGNCTCIRVGDCHAYRRTRTIHQSMKNATQMASSPSRSFELEAQLCQVLTRQVLSALGISRPVTMLGEVQVGFVIPDLVFVCSATAPEQPRFEFTGFESWIIADLLRARARRSETLAERIFARPERTAEALRRLERRGVVHRSSRAAFMLRDWFPRESEVFAVEAKLARWRDAVDQAAEYLGFANRSYVALPTETIDRSDAILRACKKRGLGLLSVSPDGVGLVRDSPLHHTSSPGWVWLVGRALSQSQPTEPMQRQVRSATLAGG